MTSRRIRHMFDLLLQAEISEEVDDASKKKVVALCTAHAVVVF